MKLLPSHASECAKSCKGKIPSFASSRSLGSVGFPFDDGMMASLVVKFWSED